MIAHDRKFWAALVVLAPGNWRGFRYLWEVRKALGYGYG